MFWLALATAHIELVQASAVVATVLESFEFMSPELGWGTMIESATVNAKCSVGLRDGLAFFVGLMPQMII